MLPQKSPTPEAQAAEPVARLVRPPTERKAPPAIHSPQNSRRWKVVLLLAIVAICAGYATAQWLLGPKVPAYAVAAGDIVQTIVASGRVATPLRVSVGAQITARVAEIPVAEGQSVSAGATLVQLDDREVKAALTAARAAVVEAQAHLKQIDQVALPAAQQALARAQVNLANVSKQYERQKELLARGLATQAQFDDAATNLKVAESEVRSAQLQVDTNRPQGGDYLVASTTLEQAQANLATALARADYTAIRAPVAGTLIARSVERGDVVQPGKELMVLSPAGATQLVVQIDEKNLANLALGQPALASADAYPDRNFQAEVAYINPGIDASRGSVEVKLDVPDAPPYLRQDMTVSVDIEVARSAHTLILATDAIHENSGPVPWVMKVENSKVQRQAVKLGVRGAGRVEVLAGLRAGDRVASATAAKVKPGERVRTTLLTRGAAK